MNLDHIEIISTDDNGICSCYCKIHDISFKKKKSNLKRSKGCKLCSNDSYKKKRFFGLEKFIEKANVVHNNFYDYTESIYDGMNNKIIIKCPIHGIFYQTPSSHLNGHGCSKCGDERVSKALSYDKETWLTKFKEVHGDTYNYSKIDYKYVKNDKTYNRKKFQKHKLKNVLEKFDENKSEFENMIDNGFRRIWGCGNRKYVYEK